MPASYNLIRLGKEVVQNSEKAIEWCKEQGLLPSNRDCWNCRQPMQYEATEASVVFDVDVRLPRVFVGIEITGSSCAGKTVRLRRVGWAWSSLHDGRA